VEEAPSRERKGRQGPFDAWRWRLGEASKETFVIEHLGRVVTREGDEKPTSRSGRGGCDRTVAMAVVVGRSSLQRDQSSNGSPKRRTHPLDTDPECMETHNVSAMRSSTVQHDHPVPFLRGLYLPFIGHITGNVGTIVHGRAITKVSFAGQHTTIKACRGGGDVSYVAPHQGSM